MNSPKKEQKVSTFFHTISKLTIILQEPDKKHVASISSTRSNVIITAQYRSVVSILSQAKKFQSETGNYTFTSNQRTNLTSKMLIKISNESYRRVLTRIFICQQWINIRFDLMFHYIWLMLFKIHSIWRAIIAFGNIMTFSFFKNSLPFCILLFRWFIFLETLFLLYEKLLLHYCKLLFNTWFMLRITPMWLIHCNLALHSTV